MAEKTTLTLYLVWLHLDDGTRLRYATLDRREAVNLARGTDPKRATVQEVEIPPPIQWKEPS